MMDYIWSAVSSHGNSFDLLLFLAASAVKATLLLGVVALLCKVSRRTSAATRHTLWTLSLCAVLLFPFLSFFRVWEVPVSSAQLSSRGAAPSKEVLTADDNAFPPIESRRQQAIGDSPKINESRQRVSDFQSPINSAGATPPAGGLTDTYEQPQNSATFLSRLTHWALAVWFAGVLVLLLKLLLGQAATALLTRHAVEFKDPALIELFSSLFTKVQLKGKVRLLRSGRTLTPVVCGVLHPAVLLPAGAEDWSEERKGMVLLHELKHVSRKDCLTQLLAQTVCAIYWFNPFVWYAARRLRVEREQACDDYVLSVGTKPSDYAHHLLDIARSLKRPALEWSQTTTVAMARRSQLEGRLLAILSKEGKRRATPQAMTAGFASLTCALFLALALVQPTIGVARNPRLSNLDASEKSLFGSTLNLNSEPEDGTVTQRLTQSNRSREDLSNGVDESREKSSVGEPVNSDSRQSLKADDWQDVGSDALVDAAHQRENIPTPEVGPTVNPFIKTIPQQPEQARQDKSGDFIDEMASVGYTNLSVDELIKLKSSGVTADFVRSLAALGFAHLTTRELTSFANNGITPDYIREIRAAGYNDLSARELTSFRNNGVTAEYIKSLRGAGYSNLPAKQLISFAANGVTTSFISGIRAAGYNNLSAEEIISVRANGITPEFIRKARSRLGELTLRQIVSLKNAGILEDDVDKNRE